MSNVVPYGDQGVGGDEDVDLGGGQLTGLVIQEQVAVVDVQLGALAILQHVLHGQLVQTEFLADHGELFRTR
jgi:hypothetical protein